MQGDPDVVGVLNSVLTAELTAVNQYFLDAKMLDNWGYGELGAWFRTQSIDEMRDVETLMDRILYLEGLPNLARLDPLRVGETAVEKIELAAVLEREAVGRLISGLELCIDRHDPGSRDLLAGILHGEEEHLDQLETRLELISQIGAELYLAGQVSR